MMWNWRTCRTHLADFQPHKISLTASDRKTTKAEPLDLYPTLGTGINRVDPALVDYALALEPSVDHIPVIEKALETMHRHGDLCVSVSQSGTKMLKNRSIFSNLEMKKENGGDPVRQLGIWCSAGHQKNAQLVHESQSWRLKRAQGQQSEPFGAARGQICEQSESMQEYWEGIYKSLPALPCWTTDGHRWQLYVVRRRARGLVVSGHVLLVVDPL